MASTPPSDPKDTPDDTAPLSHPPRPDEPVPPPNTEPWTEGP